MSLSSSASSDDFSPVLGLINVLTELAFNTGINTVITLITVLTTNTGINTDIEKILYLKALVLYEVYTLPLSESDRQSQTQTSSLIRRSINNATIYEITPSHVVFCKVDRSVCIGCLQQLNRELL